MWTRGSMVVAAVCMAAPAFGAPPAGEPPALSPAPVVDEYDDSDELPVPAHGGGPVLARPPGLAAALEGYAGVALLVGPGDTRSRGLVCGLLRFRYGYFQLGGAFEMSDSGESVALEEPLEEHWRTVQAFAGAWLPFDHFVDLDASVGYARRSFANSDPIYGPGGFDIGGSALALRFGISDRSTEKRWGARFGFAVIGTVDLSSLTAPFERVYRIQGGAIGITRGTTEVGGVSIALAVGGGFELGGGSSTHL